MSRIPRDVFFRLRDGLDRAMKGKRTELISHYMLEYPKPCRYGLPRECFDEMTEAEYEGCVFPIFKKYDLYLGTY